VFSAMATSKYWLGNCVAKNSHTRAFTQSSRGVIAISLPGSWPALSQSQLPKIAENVGLLGGGLLGKPLALGFKIFGTAGIYGTSFKLIRNLCLFGDHVQDLRPFYRAP